MKKFLFLVMLPGCVTTPPSAQVCPSFFVTNSELKTAALEYCGDQCPVTIFKFKKSGHYHIICADKEWIEDKELTKRRLASG